MQTSDAGACLQLAPRLFPVPCTPLQLNREALLIVQLFPLMSNTLSSW